MKIVYVSLVYLLKEEYRRPMEGSTFVLLV